jgi:predicted small secreted protein
MKKVLFTLLVCFVALTACQSTAEGYINDLNDLIEKVVKEGSEYTEEQWEIISKDFEELVKKAEELEGLTEEQKKKYPNFRVSLKELF